MKLEKVVTKNIQVVNEGTSWPFVVADDWYSPEEEKRVWAYLTCLTLQEDIDRAETSIVAKDTKGESKSLAYRWYTDEWYTEAGDKKMDFLSQYRYKNSQQALGKYIKRCMPFARSYFASNFDNIIVSYYEEGDHYKAHYDSFQWTQLTWFVKEPRLFNGGDLDFPESKTEVKLKHNRSVFFPSCYLHRVSPIKFHTKPQDIGFGRYTITDFFGTMPRGFNDGRVQSS